MPRTRFCPLAILVVWSSLAIAETPPTNVIPRPTTDESAVPWADRFKKDKASATSGGTSTGWWLGSVVVVAALAVFGGASRVSKRFLPSRASGPIQVVGRASLSPKQSVFLVRVGDRVLILGTGPQGGPTPLGEVTDPAELARLAPGRLPRTGLDRRIGGEA